METLRARLRETDERGYLSADQRKLKESDEGKRENLKFLTDLGLDFVGQEKLDLLLEELNKEHEKNPDIPEISLKQGFEDRQKLRMAAFVSKATGVELVENGKINSLRTVEARKAMESKMLEINAQNRDFRVYAREVLSSKN